MTDESEKIINQIRDMIIDLRKKYPSEAIHGSKESLWTHGLNDGMVPPAMYNAVKKFYGVFWTYVGDTPREL